VKCVLGNGPPSRTSSIGVSPELRTLPLSAEEPAREPVAPVVESEDEDVRAVVAVARTDRQHRVEPLARPDVERADVRIVHPREVEALRVVPGCAGRAGDGELPSSAEAVRSIGPGSELRPVAAAGSVRVPRSRDLERPALVRLREDHLANPRKGGRRVAGAGPAVGGVTVEPAPTALDARRVKVGLHVVTPDRGRDRLLWEEKGPPASVEGSGVDVSQNSTGRPYAFGGTLSIRPARDQPSCPPSRRASASRTSGRRADA